MENETKLFLLLRGLSRESRHWGEFPEKLQSQFPSARIIAVDLPGNGQYCKIKSPLTINAMLDFVRKEVKPVMHGEAMCIIGLSMGAMLAIEWMRCYPEECKSAVLMNTSLKSVSPFYQRLQPASYRKLLASLFDKDDYAREKMILQLTSSSHRASDQLLKDWVSYAQQYPVSGKNALRQLFAASRYTAPKQKPDIPVLLLSGKNDRLVNAYCSTALSRYWNIPLQIHPTAGHDLSLDDADWVCKKIAHWLA